MVWRAWSDDQVGCVNRVSNLGTGEPNFEMWVVPKL